MEDCHIDGIYAPDCEYDYVIHVSISYKKLLLLVARSLWNLKVVVLVVVFVVLGGGGSPSYVSCVVGKEALTRRLH